MGKNQDVGCQMLLYDFKIVRTDCIVRLVRHAGKKEVLLCVTVGEHDHFEIPLDELVAAARELRKE